MQWQKGTVAVSHAVNIEPAVEAQASIQRAEPTYSRYRPRLKQDSGQWVANQRRQKAEKDSMISNRRPDLVAGEVRRNVVVAHCNTILRCAGATNILRKSTLEESLRLPPELGVQNCT